MTLLMHLFLVYLVKNGASITVSKDHLSPRNSVFFSLLCSTLCHSVNSNSSAQVNSLSVECKIAPSPAAAADARAAAESGEPVAVDLFRAPYIEETPLPPPDGTGEGGGGGNDGDVEQVTAAYGAQAISSFLFPFSFSNSAFPRPKLLPRQSLTPPLYVQGFKHSYCVFPYPCISLASFVPFPSVFFYMMLLFLLVE
jgi:hypothetical protein